MEASSRTEPIALVPSQKGVVGGRTVSGPAPSLCPCSKTRLEDLAPLFDIFTLPALQSLDIEGLNETTAPQPPPLAEYELASLLRRSRCSLTELMLDADVTPGGLLNILRMVEESLKTLYVSQIGSGCITDVVLIPLTRQLNEDGIIQCLCPRLNRFYFTGGLSAIRSRSVLPTMLESRLANNNPFLVNIELDRSRLCRNDIWRLQSLDAHFNDITIRFVNG